MNTFIGVDPGMSGAVVVIMPFGIRWCRGDETESDIAEFINDLSFSGSFAFIERVSAMPKQGVSSTFRFGQSYGFFRGCLVSAGIPFEEVGPQKWQRAMGILKVKDESHTDKKNRHKARAQQLFPGVKVTHQIADALLIAEHCRRMKG